MLPLAREKRCVFDPGADEPLVQYDGADFTTERFLVADEIASGRMA